MNCLAIDTSSDRVKLALRRQSGTKTKFGRSLRSQASELAGLANELCSECGIKVSDIEAVAVSLGPGSFTGVRVGLAYAKGLALGLGTPLVGVSKFDQALSEFSEAPDLSLICMKPGMYYVSHYAEMSVGTTEEIRERLSAISNPTLALIDCPDAGSAFPMAANIKTIEPTPETLLTLAEPLYPTADEQSWLELEPIYVGPSSAERRFENRGG